MLSIIRLLTLDSWFYASFKITHVRQGAVEIKLHKQMKLISHSQLLYSTSNKIKDSNIDRVTKITVKEDMTYQNLIK